MKPPKCPPASCHDNVEEALVKLAEQDGNIIARIPKELRSKTVKQAAISSLWTSVRFLDVDEIDEDLARQIGLSASKGGRAGLSPGVNRCLGYLPVQYRQAALDAAQAEDGHDN